MELSFLAFKVVLILLLSSEISAYGKFASEYSSKETENNFDDDKQELNLHDFRLLKKIINGNNDYKRILFLKKFSNHLLTPLVEVYKALLFIKPVKKETNLKSKLSSVILKDILNNLNFHENKWKRILIKTDKDVSLKSKKDSTTTSETPEPKNSLTINKKLSKSEDFPQILKYTPRNKKPYILSRNTYIKPHLHQETEPKSFQTNKKTLENTESEDNLEGEFTYTPQFEFIKQDNPEDIDKTKESKSENARTGKAVFSRTNEKVLSVPSEKNYPKIIKLSPSDKGVKGNLFSAEQEYVDENVESTEDVKEDKEVNPRENKHKSIEPTKKMIEKNNFVNKGAMTKEINYPIVFKVKPQHKIISQDIINKPGEKNKRKEQNINRLNKIGMTSNFYQEIKNHSPKSALETHYLEKSNKIAHGMSKNYPIVFRITPSVKSAKIIPVSENDINVSRSENKNNFLAKPMINQAIHNQNLKNKSKKSKTQKNVPDNSRKFHLKINKGSFIPVHFIMKNKLLTNKIGLPEIFNHLNVDAIPMLNLPKQILFNRHESQNIPFRSKDIMEDGLNGIEQFRNIKFELPSKLDKFYSDIQKEIPAFFDEQLSNYDNSYYNGNHGETSSNEEMRFGKFSQGDIKKPKVNKDWDIFYRNPFFQFYL